MIIYPGILPHGALVAPNGVQVYSTLTGISGIVVEFDYRLMQVMSSASKSAALPFVSFWPRRIFAGVVMVGRDLASSSLASRYFVTSVLLFRASLPRFPQKYSQRIFPSEYEYRVRCNWPCSFSGLSRFDLALAYPVMLNKVESPI
jgi:hypothetical protein